jgi:hypothetical protein
MATKLSVRKTYLITDGLEGVVGASIASLTRGFKFGKTKEVIHSLQNDLGKLLVTTVREGYVNSGGKFEKGKLVDDWVTARTYVLSVSGGKVSGGVAGWRQEPVGFLSDEKGILITQYYSKSTDLFASYKGTLRMAETRHS